MGGDDPKVGDHYVPRYGKRRVASQVIAVNYDEEKAELTRMSGGIGGGPRWTSFKTLRTRYRKL